MFQPLSSQQIAEVFKIGLPLKEININQGFGQNTNSFYAELGMKGHNGLDLYALTGTKCYACFDGKVTVSGADLTGGIELRIESKEFECQEQIIKLEATYYHLESFWVQAPEIVTRGQEIASSDNTGKYTTGAHLHFGIKIYYKDGNTWVKDYNNGYKGAIDPLPLLEMLKPVDLAFLKSKEGKYLQLTESRGEIYKVEKGVIRFLSSEKQEDRHIPLVDAVIVELRNLKRLEAISNKDFKRIEGAIK